MKLITFIKY